MTNLTYAYDALHRLTNRWSQAKGTTRYRYDRLGSLTNVGYPASADLTFRYDALRRLTNLVDGLGTSAYTYAGGLLTGEDGPWAGDTVSYTYNGARRRSQMAVGQPAGNAWTNSYAYDAARRLTNVTSPAGSFGYGYKGGSPASLVARLSLPGGPYLTNSFDANGRLADTTLNTAGGMALNRHGYLNNLANQRHRLSRTNSANAGWAGYWTNTYDAAGELRTLRGHNGSGTAVPADDYDYGYDAAWNLAKRTNNGAVTSYTVDNLNQVTSDGASYTHDSSGNRTSGPGSPSTVTYTYDDENQLVAAQVPLYWKQTYAYDGRQRARVRQDHTWSGSAWVLSAETRYVYDGLQVLQERTSANVPQVSYTRGLDLSGSLSGAGGIGGLLARSAHSATTPYPLSASAYYHADGNGNVTALVDSAGALQASYRYDAYGRTLASSGALAAANLMRFSSKPLWAPNAAGGGLYYYGYRFYDPTSARWVNRDPIGEEGGVNLYLFNRNSPFGYVDPDGQNSIAIPWPVFPPITIPTIPAPPPVLAGGAVFVGGVAVGYYIGDRTGFHDWAAEQLAKGYVICMSRPHGKGERNWGHESDNPWKGWRVDPNDPTKIRGRDPRDGKWKTKPRPPEFPDPKPQPPKPNPAPNPPEGEQ